MRFPHVGVGLVLALAPEVAAVGPVGPTTTETLGVERTQSAPVRFAILPLRNLSADAQGARELQERLCATLARRGTCFVTDGDLEAVLRPRRVRYTDSLSVADARAVHEATGASHLLAGVVFDFERGPEPRIGATVRVIDLATGERVQSAFVSLRGVDSRGLLGLGGVDDVHVLVERAVERLVAVFGPHGEPLAHVRASPRRPEKEADSLDRLALLPFANRSTRTDAGTSFADLLGHAWFQETGARIIEVSELRSALVRARIRSLQEMDASTLSSIGSVLHVRWFVLGSVDRFGEEQIVRDQRYPEIEVTVRVVDARTGLVTRSKNLRLRGDVGETVLRLGIEHDPLALAARAAHELVLELENGS